MWKSFIAASLLVSFSAYGEVKVYEGKGLYESTKGETGPYEVKLY